MEREEKQNVVKEKPGPQGAARRARTELDAFNLFYNNGMINRTVTSTNKEIEKKRNTMDKLVRHQDTTPDEIRCFIGLLLFRGLHRDIKNPTTELWYDDDFTANVPVLHGQGPIPVSSFLHFVPQPSNYKAGLPN